MKINYWKVALALLIIAIVGGLFARKIAKSKEIRIDENALYSVAYVTDGDTFKVRIGKKMITVRELGIDTPETVDLRKPVQCYGKEASEENKKLLIGKKVKLKLNPDREEKDKYGRYLAYVYLEDGALLNQKMIAEGFAREYTYGRPYSLQGEFRGAQKMAQEAKKGLWGACPIL